MTSVNQITDTPKTPQQDEAFAEVVSTLADSLFLILSDDKETVEETERLVARTTNVAYFSLALFYPEVISTETTEDGSKKFIFSMTIPTTDTFDNLFNRYKEIVGDWSEDEDENNE